MMKPKKTIVTRYRKEEEQANTIEHALHNPTSPRRNNVSRVNVNKNKNRGLPEFVDYTTYKLIVNTSETEKNDLQKELAEQRKKCAYFTSWLGVKDKEIAELNQSISDEKKNLDDREEKITELTELSKTSEKKITSLNKEKEKLKKKITSLQSDIRKLKVQKEKDEKSLQKVRQLSKEEFKSKIHPNYGRLHSKMIADIVELYESCYHGDKPQHCPAVQYMNELPELTTSPWIIEDVAPDNEPPSKKRKMDHSMGTDKHYSKNSLKVLVMGLEPRHSDKFELWRNVLWALNQYGRERGYDTLKIADCFSKRSSKYKNLQDVRQTFESSDGTLSLQYLIEISKIYEQGLDKMTQYLNKLLPSSYTPLTIEQVDIRDRQNFRLNVNYANESHTLFIIPELYILGDEDRQRICFLENKIKSEKSELATLCPQMKKGFVVTLKKQQYEFQAKNDPSATIQLIRPLKPDESFIILPSGKRDNKELNLIEIRKALREEAIKLLTAKCGKKFADDKDDNNVFKFPSEDSNMCRTDNELVEALTDLDPDTMSRYCYSTGVIYYCNPSTNLWCKLTIATFDSHLRKNLKNTLKLTKTELKYINMAHAIVRIRNVALDQIENLDFPGLDSNLHLFITNNRTVVTSSIPPIIRNIKKEDLAETTCGWSYNCELSIRHMKSVLSYFDKLIPQQHEREWFLSFVAKLLNGQRKNKYCLVLTDERGKKNGTSTLMSLLETVFGKYFVADTKIVVAGGSRENQYDGGIYNLEGKRLLVANELKKTDILDRAFIKSITSQSDYYIQDKRKFSRTPVKFFVQAGLIMTFNKDNVPKFDKNDPDFVERIVAIPMRSRFLSKPEIHQMTRNGEKTTDIHIADDSLRSQFPEWSSAVLDLLTKYCNKSVPAIPDSMVDCTKTLCNANYDYWDWLDSHILRDKNVRKFVTATDIMTAITKTQENNPREMLKLKLMLSLWAEKNGFHYKARHVYMGDHGKRVEAKSAIMGSRLCNTRVEE